MSTIQANPAAPVQAGFLPGSGGFPASRTCAVLQQAGQAAQNARQRCLSAAQSLSGAGLYVLVHALHFTAAQEKEHAAVFRGLLAARGVQLLPDDLPCAMPADPLALLQGLIQSEADAAERLYPLCAETARAEGYPRIAGALLRMAETKDRHVRRFRQYEQALRSGTLFRHDTLVSWVCIPCAQLHIGCEPPERCASCGSDRGHFIRSSGYPFALEE